LSTAACSGARRRRRGAVFPPAAATVWPGERCVSVVALADALTTLGVRTGRRADRRRPRPRPGRGHLEPAGAVVPGRARGPALPSHLERTVGAWVDGGCQPGRAPHHPAATVRRPYTMAPAGTLAGLHAHERLRRRLQPVLRLPQGHTVPVARPASPEPPPPSWRRGSSHPLLHGAGERAAGRPTAAAASAGVPARLEDHP
jgi:hypothetical protein